jgi:beta-aspartyl-peptidase (threonine type)
MNRSVSAALLALTLVGGFVPAHAGTPAASAQESSVEEKILAHIRTIAARQKPNRKPEDIDVDKLLSAQGFYEADLVFIVEETEATYHIRFYKDELGATTEDLVRTLTVRKLADVTARKLKRPEIRRVSLMVENPAEKGVRAILDAQVAAWNRGDIEAFMEGYWKSPELTFVSGTSVTKGWDETLARYRKRYQSEGREMGTLTFDDLDIQVFSKDAAVVRGAWKLKMKDSNPGGRFTLIFRHFKEGWRIVYDHTS